MRIPDGPSGFPTLSPTQLRAYGAGGFRLSEQELPRGCPRQYKARYVERRVPAEFSYELDHGRFVHEVLYLMEDRGLTPDEALVAALPAGSTPESFAEARADVDAYMQRGASPTDRYATLGVELGLDAELYVDEEFGPVRIRAIVDWVGTDTDQPNLLHVVDYKDLPLGTRLPTPTGWTTVGAVREGDLLLGSDGSPVRVVGKSAVFTGNDLYRITFDDSSTIDAGAEHGWTVLAGLRGGRRTSLAQETVTTEKIAVLRQEGVTVRIPNAAALNLPDADLPLDPYVLGAWLGDGSASCGTITKPYEPLFDEIRSRGYQVGPITGAAGGRTVYGIRGVLRKLGVLGNKHVPAAYLRGSYQQRLDLLRGLMDTDGSWNKTRRRAVLSTTSLWLAEAIRDVVVTLGWKATIFPFTVRGFGLVKPGWQVWFTPTDECPFLTRVPESWRPGRSSRSRERLVRSVQRIPTVPTQCLMVDAPDHLFLAGEQMVPTHNTNRRPPATEDVRGDVQLKIQHFVAAEWARSIGIDNPRIVMHLDAIKFREVEVAFTEADIAAFRDWAEALARAIWRDDEALPVLNPNCDRCPVRGDCPAYADLPAAAEAMLTGLAGITDDRARLAWRDSANRVRLLLEKAVKGIDADFKARAMADGLVPLGPVEFARTGDWTEQVDLVSLHQAMGPAFYDVVSTTRKKVADRVEEWDPADRAAALATFSRSPAGYTVTRRKAESREEADA